MWQIWSVVSNDMQPQSYIWVGTIYKQKFCNAYKQREPIWHIFIDRGDIRRCTSLCDSVSLTREYHMLKNQAYVNIRFCLVGNMLRLSYWMSSRSIFSQRAGQWMRLRQACASACELSSHPMHTSIMRLAVATTFWLIDEQSHSEYSGICMFHFKNVKNGQRKHSPGKNVWIA